MRASYVILWADGHFRAARLNNASISTAQINLSSHTLMHGGSNVLASCPGENLQRDGCRAKIWWQTFRQQNQRLRYHYNVHSEAVALVRYHVLTKDWTWQFVFIHKRASALLTDMGLNLIGLS